MGNRSIVFFALAFLFGTAAVFTGKSLLEDRASPEPAALATQPVLVAQVDVAVGSALQARQLDTVEWPKEYLPAGSFRAAGDVQGRVLRRPLAAGEPVLESALLPKGSEAGLASVIEGKMRAVSVKVDPVIGVAGFVRPGAHVDVLATLHRVDQPSKIPYSKLVIQDVRVLAVDQQMETAKDRDPELVSVVTLAVTPRQAEQLIYSATQGELQLALRSPGDRELVETVPVSVADLLGPGRKPRPRIARGPSVQVLKGSSVEVERF